MGVLLLLGVVIRCGLSLAVGRRGGAAEGCGHRPSAPGPRPPQGASPSREERGARIRCRASGGRTRPPCGPWTATGPRRAVEGVVDEAPPREEAALVGLHAQPSDLDC